MSRRLSIFAIIASLFLVASPVLVSAQGQLVAECDPTETNLNADNACGLKKAIETIQNVIRWGQMIIIPIAVFFIGLGGFTILTSGGSSERVSSGKKMMTIAVTGVVLMLLSGLMIRAVFQFLVQDYSAINAPTGIEGSRNVLK